MRSAQNPLWRATGTSEGVLEMSDRRLHFNFSTQPTLASDLAAALGL
jgi:hypothetical protein